MKKIFLFTILLILVSSFTKADDKDSYFKLKSITSLKDIHSIECDLCGCYLGIEPKFGNNSIGLRYSYFNFQSSDAVPVDDRETEIFSKVELVGKININPKFRVLLTVPFKLNDINGKNVRDLGDVSIMGQYLIYSTAMSFKNETRYRQRFYLGGGINVPTGTFNTELVPGIVDPHFQAGTGAFTFLVNGSYFSKFRELGFNLDAAYTAALANRNVYKFGNRLNLATNISYEAGIGEVGLLPHAGLYYESAEFDKQDGVDIDDSGGNVLFLTGGVDSYFNRFSFNINYDYPISQKLNEEPINNFRIITGITYFIGL